MGVSDMTPVQVLNLRFEALSAGSVTVHVEYIVLS